MKNVNRHTIDYDVLQEQLTYYREGISSTIKHIQEGRFDLLDILFNKLVSLAGYQDADRPSSPEVCRYLRLICQLISVVLTAASEKTVPVKLPLGEQQLEIVPDEIGWQIDEKQWLFSCYSTVICTSSARLNALLQVEPERLKFYPSGTQYYFYYLLAAPLQAILRDDTNAHEVIEQARQAVRAVPKFDDYLEEYDESDSESPDLKDYVDDDYAPLVIEPQLDLMSALLSHNALRFNETLLEALEKHKSYWGQEEHSVDPVGLIAWGPLALARLAGKRGIPVIITSDYLPKLLVDGNCHCD